MSLTQRLLDDGIAELTERPGRRVTLHADAVRHVGVEVRQHGVPHAGAENHLTLVLDLLFVERSVVDVEAFYCPLVRVRLLQGKTRNNNTATFGFRSIGLFFQRSLQVGPGPPRSSKEEHLGIAGSISYRPDACPVPQPAASKR